MVDKSSTGGEIRLRLIGPSRGLRRLAARVGDGSEISGRLLRLVKARTRDMMLFVVKLDVDFEYYCIGRLASRLLSIRLFVCNGRAIALCIDRMFR